MGSISKLKLGGLVPAYLGFTPIPTVWVLIKNKDVRLYELAVLILKIYFFVKKNM